MLNGWLVLRLDQAADLQNLPGDFASSFSGKPWERQFGHPVFFFHADDNIAAAIVADVVCKGADCVQDMFRIPFGQAFYAGVFCCSALNEFFYADWQ